MKSNPSRRTLTAVLVVAMVCVHAGFPALASGPALFQGRVVAGDGATPRSGIVVTLVDVAGGKHFASKPSDERGTFRVDSAPPGSYNLVAEAPEGAFLASGKLELIEGDNTPVSLALKPRAPQDDDDDEDDDEGIIPPPPPPPGGLETWVRWVLGGSIIVGGLAVVDLLGEDEDSVSPF